MGTDVETDFFCVSETYLITVTYDSPKGVQYDERRDLRRFVFWDKREYIRKRVELLETEGIQNIYCVENQTTTISSSRKDRIV